MNKDVSFTLTAVSKLIPAKPDVFDEFKPHERIATRKDVDIKDQGKFSEAIELNLTDEEQSRSLDIKNETLNGINLGVFHKYGPHLMHLNISMSKITHIEGSFDSCPQLTTLILSDNLIREITPFMFQKCKRLRSVNLDIN
jgi:Leucine-rich repeat (LRR) protein